MKQIKIFLVFLRTVLKNPTFRGLSAESINLTLKPDPGFRGQAAERSRLFKIPSIFLIYLVLLCFCSPALAELSLKLDKDQVQQGETFTLTLKIEGNQINAMPNFMPLQNDFTIEGTQSSVNSLVVNGKVHSTAEWTLLLSAKRSGIVTIPSLDVGQEKTKPTTIEIIDEAPTQTKPTSRSESTPQAQQQKDVMLLTEISDISPYINQQVIYTVKLYNSSRLLDANYQPPQVEDALFIPMGNGRRYQVNENDRIYAVEEQQFALFPQKSGYIKIKPPSFHALIYNNTPKRVSVEAKPSTLNVKPIPSQFKGKNWLPAKQVSLSENYDKSTTSLVEGSTLVRTVSLQAVAIPAQLLPVLDFGNSDEYSVYPEKPVEFNQFKQQDLVGRVTVKATYLLNKPGRVTIPPLNVPWFNTITGKEEISSLPGFTIEVTPSTAAKQNEPATQALNNPSQPKSSSIVQQTEKKTEEKTLPNSGWWLALGFALAWLVTLAAWAYQRRNGSSTGGQTKAQVLKKLKEACLNNNPIEARSALLNWGHLLRPDARLLNLFDLESLIEDPILKKQINHLAEVLYHPKKSGEQWQGRALWDALVNFKPKKSAKINTNNRLPPLNRI